MEGTKYTQHNQTHNINIGIPESVDDWPARGQPQDVGVDSHGQKGVLDYSGQ